MINVVFIVSLSLALILFGVAPEYIGLYGMLLCFVCIFTCKSFLTLVLGFLNFSVSIAFDYYLRVWPHGFEFYDLRGIGVEELALFSTLAFLVVLYLDFIYLRRGESGVSIPNIQFDVSHKLYWPLLLAVSFCIVFVALNAGSLFSSEFSLAELKKYSFLEYFSVIVFFFILSSRDNFRLYLSLFVSALFVGTLLMASYRMVAIIIVMTIVLAFYRGKQLHRGYLIGGWGLIYVLMALISYFRGGLYDIGLSQLLGYKDFGYLDNTFTGVIETALIYSSIYEEVDFSIRFFEFIGVLLPLPGFLLPDSMIYYSDLDSRYFGRIPGGGLLAGFFYYFDFLFVPVWFFYIGAVYYCLGLEKVTSWFYSGLVFVMFVSVSRWWLYGPYVLFKFLGVFFLFVVINKALLSHSKEGSNG